MTKRNYKEEERKLEQEIKEQEEKVRKIREELKKEEEKLEEIKKKKRKLYRVESEEKIMIPLLHQDTVKECQEIVREHIGKVFNISRETGKIKVRDNYVGKEKIINLGDIRINIEYNRAEWVSSKYIPPREANVATKSIIQELQKMYKVEEKRKRKREEYIKLFDNPVGNKDPVLTKIVIHKRDRRKGLPIDTYTIIEIL